MSLKGLRKKIDGVDRQIIRLLNARARITLEVAGLKFKKGASTYSPDREREVLNRIKQANSGPLSVKALEAIYREIMSGSLSLQRQLEIAYLGPPASFSHLAALKRFGSQVKLKPVDNISDVFLQVEKGVVDYGVVPVENSIEGVVSHTLDLFVDAELKICAQIILDVSHNLLANCPMIKIKRVFSNPSVLGQCRLWLEENLSDAEKIEVSSTTRAAQIAARQKNSACIASSLAARVYKLKVIARDIEDSSHNATRFLVIGQADVPPTGNDRTSVLFSIKDRVGALHDMLVPFKKHKINLTKIESRPSRKKAWDYYFFIDLEGHSREIRVKKALEELQKQCTFLKILGSYPVGE